MAEYIEREAYYRQIDNLSKGKHGVYCAAINDCMNTLDEQPAADVVEVRHGVWEKHDQYICNSDDKPVAKIGVIFICSECGREEYNMEPYCHCGAKMDGKGEKDD